MINTKTNMKFDKQSLDNIKKFIEENHMVKIGVLADEIRSMTITENSIYSIGTVELAMVHEFGSEKRNIPKRSFFRKTMTGRSEDFKNEIETNKDRIMQSIAEGRGNQVLQKAGATWVRYVYDTFDAEGPGWDKLSDYTLMRRRNFQIEQEKAPTASLATLLKRTRKGSKILQDTGEMKKSITFQVV